MCRWPKTKRLFDALYTRSRRLEPLVFLYAACLTVTRVTDYRVYTSSDSCTWTWTKGPNSTTANATTANESNASNDQQGIWNCRPRENAVDARLIYEVRTYVCLYV